MKKIIWLFALLSPLGAFAQLNMFGDQELIRKALDSSLYIIRQEYILVSNSGIEYSQVNKDYYGMGYAAGFLDENGAIYTDQRILSPWKSDPAYRRYENVDSLTPKISVTYIRPLYGKNFTEFRYDSIQQLSNNLCAYHSNKPSEGLSLYTAARPAEAWAVLAYCDKPAAEVRDSTPVKVAIFKSGLQYDSLGYALLTKAPKMTYILGGGLVNTHFSAKGIIQFKLAGGFTFFLTKPAVAVFAAGKTAEAMPDVELAPKPRAKSPETPTPEANAGPALEAIKAAEDKETPEKSPEEASKNKKDEKKNNNKKKKS